MLTVEQIQTVMETITKAHKEKQGYIETVQAIRDNMNLDIEDYHSMLEVAHAQAALVGMPLEVVPITPTTPTTKWHTSYAECDDESFVGTDRQLIAHYIYRYFMDNEIDLDSINQRTIRIERTGDELVVHNTDEDVVIVAATCDPQIN